MALFIAGLTQCWICVVSKRFSFSPLHKVSFIKEYTFFAEPARNKKEKNSRMRKLERDDLNIVCNKFTFQNIEYI